MKKCHDIVQCDVLQLIFKVKCGHCGVVNYFSDENFEDMSKMDPEGISCWSCEKESFFENCIMLKKIVSSDLKNEYMSAADGHKDLRAVL